MATDKSLTPSVALLEQPSGTIHFNSLLILPICIGFLRDATPGMDSTIVT